MGSIVGSDHERLGGSNYDCAPKVGTPLKITATPDRIDREKKKKNHHPPIVSNKKKTAHYSPPHTS